jgi:hypothetical protein
LHDFFIRSQNFWNLSWFLRLNSHNLAIFPPTNTGPRLRKLWTQLMATFALGRSHGYLGSKLTLRCLTSAQRTGARFSTPRQISSVLA